MEGKAVILRGNISDGYEVIGPFNSWDEASDYDAKFYAGMNWIMSLQEPENAPSSIQEEL